MLTAMAGYNEAETERVKALSEIIRRATTHLVNTQPITDGPVTPYELWPLPWDCASQIATESVTEEEKQRRQQAQDNFLTGNNGNSNFKP
jgi:hypothetical protein